MKKCMGRDASKHIPGAACHLLVRTNRLLGSKEVTYLCVVRDTSRFAYPPPKPIMKKHLIALAAVAAIGTVHAQSTEAGVRVWQSTGNISYNLYGDTTRDEGPVSALEYKSKRVITTEAFFRTDLSNGMFVKGLAGVGKITNGVEYDEDFEPETDPYSLTETSSLKGDVKYFSVDVGYNFFTNEQVRVGGFVGYNHWNEKYLAYGCTQLATNDSCLPGDVRDDELGITEKDTFSGPRIGVVADVKVTPKLTLSAEAAYLRAKHKNTDIHHLSGLGQTDGSGNGDSSMVSLSANYAVTPAFSIGAGYRIWSVTSKLNTAPVGEDNFQLETYKTSRKGVFIQAAYSF